MRILAVDDERLALDNLVTLLWRVMPEEEVNGFVQPEDAFCWLAEHGADIAFLDIEMGGMDGITLAKRSKDLCPEINVIFVTGYEQYSLEALKLHASGYLIKPVREKDLQGELEHLRYHIPRQVARRVRIQTFGSFEVFVDGKPLLMPQAKCRECLAYLVDRKGARVNVAELAAVLWEDKPFDKRAQNNTYRVISDLVKSLRRAGVEDILIKAHREIAIDTGRVDCDYYRFLSGEAVQTNAFVGEYMSNYSWAEVTLATLAKRKSAD